MPSGATDPIWLTLVSATIGAVVSSAVSFWVTLRVVPKQYVQQRWWERRVDAYTRVLQALTQLRYVYSEWHDDTLYRQGSSHPDRDKQLSVKYRESIEALATASSASSLVISTEVSERVAKLLAEIYRPHHRHEDFLGHLEDAMGRVEVAIGRVTDLANAEVGHPSQYPLVPR